MNKYYIGSYWVDRVQTLAECLVDIENFLINLEKCLGKIKSLKFVSAHGEKIIVLSDFSTKKSELSKILLNPDLNYYYKNDSSDILDSYSSVGCVSMWQVEFVESQSIRITICNGGEINNSAVIYFEKEHLTKLDKEGKLPAVWETCILSFHPEHAYIMSNELFRKLDPDFVLNTIIGWWSYFNDSNKIIVDTNDFKITKFCAGVEIKILKTDIGTLDSKALTKFDKALNSLIKSGFVHEYGF